MRNCFLAILVVLCSPFWNISWREVAPCVNELIHPSNAEESIINVHGNTILSRFNPPAGFVRKQIDKNSFGNYLRNLSLKNDGAVVNYFDGREKSDLVYDAVVDMDIGKKDLQQCADAIMRLRGEYYFSEKEFEKISFTLTNSFRMDYSEWMKGNRLAVEGNKTHWVKSAAPSNTYADFRKYMEVVFGYAGTLSLSRSLKTKNIADIAIGDVFVHGGSPGHAVIVVEVAENKSGEKVFMIAQSFMPAQDIHILKNFNDENISPWYRNNIGELNTPQWYFDVSELKSFE
jgi:hypothetical protein